MEKQFTKYEIARILGARALQIAMDAPFLLKIKNEDLEKINYDPLKIAELELNSDVLPISVKRPMPEKSEEKKLKKVAIKEVTDEEKQKKEEMEEKEIREEGEIMELARPEDEVEEGESNEQAIE